MAEYVKFRLTAAKVGVTMALAALIAGIAEKARSGPANVSARPAALFVKLNGITGEVHNVLAKIEAKIEKLDNGVISLQKKVRTDYYSKPVANRTFLKIKKASGEFLGKEGTAANSSLLGNKGPSAFVQGNRASLVTGALSVAPSSASQTLLQIPNGTNGALILVCTPQPGNGFRITINNTTGVAIPAVIDLNGGTPTQKTLGPSTTLTTITGTTEIHLQTFPVGGFHNVITLIVSAEGGAGGSISLVGQAFTGGI